MAPQPLSGAIALARHPTDNVLEDVRSVLPSPCSDRTDHTQVSPQSVHLARHHSGAIYSSCSSIGSDHDPFLDPVDAMPLECHSPQLVEKLLEAQGDEIQAHIELHPVVRAAREENVCTNLMVGDLTKNSSLCAHFQKYALRDFFNHRGQRRYQNLSMSFAAKQHPDIKTTFGSCASASAKPVTIAITPQKSSQLSARAYRLATDMVRRDRETIQQRNLENYRNLETKEKIQLEDVQKRQHEMLFLEVADYERYLPNGVAVEELLPLEVSRIHEREEKKRFEKLNAALVDVHKVLNRERSRNVSRAAFGNVTDDEHENVGYAPAEMFDFMQQYWNFKSDDITEVVNNISLWTLAAGLSSSMGIDRSVFCRFLIDIGVIDQDAVPYVWSVRVFDQYSRHVRVNNIVENDWSTTGDAGGESKTVVAPLVCKLDFITVMDTILRRRYSKGTLSEFMEMLRRTSLQLNAEWQRKEQEAAAAAAAADRNKATPVEPTLLDKVFSGGLPALQNPQPVKIQGLMSATSMMLNDDAANAADNASRNSSSENAVWKRNRLISGMLTEPEVLQIVEQYRSVFEELFHCYTFRDDASTDTAANAPSPEMEFSDFVQFCQDFRIVPRLASMYDVLRAFRIAECVEIPEEDLKHSPEPESPQLPNGGPAPPPVQLQMPQQLKQATAEADKAADKHRQLLQSFTAMLFDRFGHLSVAFEFFDIGGDGNFRLTMTEFKAIAQKLGFPGDVKAIFRELDVHRHGHITRQDFMRLQEHVPDLAPQEHAVAAMTEEPPTPRRKPKDATGNPRLSVHHRAKPQDMTPRSMGTPSSQSSLSVNRLNSPGSTPRQSENYGDADKRSSARGHRKSVAGVNARPLQLQALHGRQPHGSLSRSHRNSSVECVMPPDVPTTDSPLTVQPPPKVIEPRFGVAAFVETLCRIALGYLIVHGNSVQTATCSRAKIVWLMAYLQAVLEHLRQSHGRRLNSSEGRRASPATLSVSELLATAPVGEVNDAGSVGGPENEPQPPPVRRSPGRKASKIRKASKTTAADSSAVSAQNSSSLDSFGNSDSVKSPMTVVSRQLKRALEQVTLQTFKAHSIMELQLDRHMPSKAAPIEAVEEPKLESPVAAISSPAKVKRRKSRYKIEAISAALLDQEAAANAEARSESEGQSRTESKKSEKSVSKYESTESVKTREYHSSASGLSAVSDEKARGRNDSNLPNWATRRLQNKALSAMQRVQQSHSRPAKSKGNYDSHDDDKIMKVGKDVGRERKNRKNTTMDSAGKPKDEAEEAKKTKEVFAVKQEPPRLQDDSFKFENLLFKRLLRRYSPQRKEKEKSSRMSPPKNRGRTLSTSSHISTGPAAWAPSLGSTANTESLNATYRPASHLSHGTADTAGDEPIMSTLSEDRHDLQKGLGSCIGKLERCMLTPPPLNTYATQLNERLEKMMGRFD